MKRGRCWEQLAEYLSAQNTYLKLSQRSVRDRYKLLGKTFQQSQAAELKASGISLDTSESDILLQDITEQFDASEKNAGEKKEKQRR